MTKPVTTRMKSAPYADRPECTGYSPLFPDRVLGLCLGMDSSTNRRPAGFTARAPLAWHAAAA